MTFSHLSNGSLRDGSARRLRFSISHSDPRLRCFPLRSHLIYWGPARSCSRTHFVTSLRAGSILRAPNISGTGLPRAAPPKRCGHSRLSGLVSRALYLSKVARDGTIEVDDTIFDGDSCSTCVSLESAYNLSIANAPINYQKAGLRRRAP